MTQETFKAQVDRLRSNYREDSYKEERVALFWRTLKTTPDSVFVEAIDELIANSRGAPMLKEILTATEEARVRDAERKADWARADTWKRGRSGFDGVVQDAADKCSTAFAKDCATLLVQKMRKEITLEEFNASMDLLDQAVAGNGCKKCTEGLVFEEDGLKKCRCLAGQRIDERVFGPRRPDGAKEVSIIPTIKFEN